VIRRFSLVLGLAALVASTAFADTPSRRSRRAPRAAEVPPLTLRVIPDTDRAFHVRVAIDVARDGVAEAVADLRWLTFEVRREGARRALRCTYPVAPTRNDPSKVVANPANGSALVDGVVDIRMYCVGAAFEALSSGATITPIYGSRTASRTRFISLDADRRARRAANVSGTSFAFVPRPFTPDESGLETVLPSVSVNGPRVITLRPSLRASREARVYLRTDAWLFDIRAPDGHVSRCVVPRHPVAPIIDFFTRLRAGRTASSTIDLAKICPNVFEAPGIYDVGAIAELVYDGGNVGITAVTGTIRGRLSFVRMRPPLGADPTEFVRPMPGSSNAL